MRRYGLTIARYEEMLEGQRGVCAICDGLPSGKNKSLCVDHDHETGAVRGLLCHRCNALIDVSVRFRSKIDEYLANPPYECIERQAS
jgi:hypothetical protein